MTYYRARVTALVCLALTLVSCGGYTHTPLASEVTRPLSADVLYCKPRTTFCESCAGVRKSRKTTPGDIDVIIHLMSALIDEARREREYREKGGWAFAPTADALTTGAQMIVTELQPPVWVEYWTPRMIDWFFGHNGKVNEIWKPYIRLILRGVEDCYYTPEQLRPDGLVRDSMPTPQTSTPWTGQLFRSINRLFTEEHPHVLHVFLWWSVAEGDIDGRIVEQGIIKRPVRVSSDNGVWGYSRSAARGGSAVWIGSHSCFTQSTEVNYLGLCAKVLAHEVGHALGLQHVEDPANLMYTYALKIYADDNRSVEVKRSQARQVRREAREQFGSR